MCSCGGARKAILASPQRDYMQVYDDAGVQSGLEWADGSRADVAQQVPPIVRSLVVDHQRFGCAALVINLP